MSVTATNVEPFTPPAIELGAVTASVTTIDNIADRASANVVAPSVESAIKGPSVAALIRTEPLQFWLGTHEVSWLRKVEIPLFISRRRLERQKKLPRATAPWALDSGGFTELLMNGEWTITGRGYVRMVRRYCNEIGRLYWAAPMDWMCEPVMLAKTGQTVAYHQKRTVINFLALREMAPELPFIPVLQGWTIDDYLRCLDLYHTYGIDLTRQPLVGVGTVCRRQATQEAKQILGTLAGLGLRLHAFGLKMQGLLLSAPYLVSSDSMAWSYDGRRLKRPCPEGHKACQNCLHHALSWRQRLLDRISCIAA